MKKIKSIDNNKATLSIGAVAHRSGLAVSAIHFYESKGLIQSWRNTGNQRRFKQDVLRRLAIIKVAQELGISLAEIKQAFGSLPKQRTPTSADWQKLSQTWRNALDERIRRLALLRNNLSGCIGCGCLSVKKCPLRNQNDKLADKGSGAILLN